MDDDIEFFVERPQRIYSADAHAPSFETVPNLIQVLGKNISDLQQTKNET